MKCVLLLNLKIDITVMHICFDFPRKNYLKICVLPDIGISSKIDSRLNFQDSIGRLYHLNGCLFQVSADFLRLHGSRQQVFICAFNSKQIIYHLMQFRSLLGRKKLGQLPQAYTQIDTQSFESNDSRQFLFRATPYMYNILPLLKYDLQFRKIH